MTHVRTRDDGTRIQVDTTSIIAMLYQAFPDDVVVTSDIDDTAHHLVSCLCDQCAPDRRHDA